MCSEYNGSAIRRPAVPIVLKTRITVGVELGAQLPCVSCDASLAGFHAACFRLMSVQGWRMVVTGFLPYVVLHILVLGWPLCHRSLLAPLFMYVQRTKQPPVCQCESFSNIERQ
jgi:hypothetical protein